MTTDDLHLLKASVDEVVRIICCDGERILGKVLVVSEEEEDVIYDLISTTKEPQYEKHDEQPAYRILFSEIDRVESE
ncbi:MAG: hypothetical protein JST79_13050 [Acidobacteria bacterium]|nr:hypothetical protein [Acidobacteriota bacterium]